MANDSPDVASNPTTYSRRHLLPPLLGLGLLIVAAIIFWPRGSERDRGQQQNGSRDSFKELSPPKAVRAVHHVSSYTVMELAEENGTRFWLAAPRMELAVGDRVVYGPAEEARDFPVKSLNRTFDRILLAREVYKLDAAGQLVPPAANGGPHGDHGMNPHGHGGHGSQTADHGLQVPKLEKPAGGQSIAELTGAAEKFSGQPVKLRGMIVRARHRVRPAPDAPPTNWYHLQDGSDASGTTLLFTTSEELQRGEIVSISGTLDTDKEFGPGLSYKLYIASPQVQREKGPAKTDSTTSPPRK